MALKPVQFFSEVKREVKKVTWPTWTETRMATIMVFIMASISAVFFFTTDQVLSAFIKMILNIKG